MLALSQTIVKLPVRRDGRMASIQHVINEGQRRMKKRNVQPSLGTRLLVQTSGLSDRGLVRTVNEDSFCFTDRLEPNCYRAESYGIYIVADGMGGHERGEIASAMAVQSVFSYLVRRLRSSEYMVPPPEVLRWAIEKAHKEILTLGKVPGKARPLGTTAVVGLRLDLVLYLAHVGDSRAYQIRGDSIVQLTEDHRFTAARARQQTMTSNAPAYHPDRGKLVRSLGVSESIEVDTSIWGSSSASLMLNEGDRILLCSDGLTDLVSGNEILCTFRKYQDPPTICASLVGLSNYRGGLDNITAVVLQVGKSHAGESTGYTLTNAASPEWGALD